MSTVTDQDTKDHISANVRAHLERLNWSQARLARETGETAMTISLLVRGVHVPGVGLLSRVAEALGCTMEDLLTKPVRTRTRTA